jgi:hypothetical protein
MLPSIFACTSYGNTPLNGEARWDIRTATIASDHFVLSAPDETLKVLISS